MRLFYICVFRVAGGRTYFTLLVYRQYKCDHTFKMPECACILLCIYISVWCLCFIEKNVASRNYVYKSSHFYLFKHKAYLHNLFISEGVGISWHHRHHVHLENPSLSSHVCFPFPTFALFPHSFCKTISPSLHCHNLHLAVSFLMSLLMLSYSELCMCHISIWL